MAAADSAHVHSFTLTNDGRELYFFKRVRPGEEYRIFRSTRIGTDWSGPIPIDLGGDFSDLYPSLSPDGTRLVFSSYRPVPGDTSKVRNAHIWMARRVGDGWSAAEFVRASLLGHYHSGLRQDMNGTLRFAVTTPDWRQTRQMQLRWNGSAFDSVPLDAPLDPALTYWRGQLGDTLHVWHTQPGPDGLTLATISRVVQPRSRRLPATYYTTYLRDDGSWAPLQPAGGGLSSGAPNFAWLSQDGCHVYYTSNYHQFMRVPARLLIRDR